MRRNEKDCAETVPYEIRVAPDSCIYDSCLMPAAALLLKSATVPRRGSNLRNLLNSRNLRNFPLGAAAGVLGKDSICFFCHGLFPLDKFRFR